MPARGLSQPRVWVRRIVLWSQPGQKIRDISLRPGLNIVWSPDGKWIAFCVHNTDPTGSYGLIKVIPSGGGAAKTVGPRWTEAVAAAWLPGSRGLLIAAAQAGIDSQQIWYVPFPSGSAR